MNYLTNITLLFIIVIGIIYLDDVKQFFKEIFDSLKFESYEDFLNKNNKNG